MFKVPETARRNHPIVGWGGGNNGYFVIEHPKIADYYFQVIASDGLGWEHVSVSLVTTKRGRKVERCPTWEEMCYVKDQFWSKDQAVIQFHPPQSGYVNNHKYCLHMWRNTEVEVPVPDSLLVGLK